MVYLSIYKDKLSFKQLINQITLKYTESTTNNKSMSKISNEIKEKFIRTSSVLKNQSISTQTSVNYTMLSPMSVQNLNR